MAQLKNIRILQNMSERDLEMMEHAAIEHKRHASISFKIIEVTPTSVTFRVVQERSTAGHYFDQKRLIEIVHETFDRFFPDQKILVHAIPYKIPGPSAVDPEWINKEMTDMSIRLKQIADDTGINYTQLSALVNGTDPLTDSMKAMFYFYFQTKKLELKTARQTKAQAN